MFRSCHRRANEKEINNCQTFFRSLIAGYVSKQTFEPSEKGIKRLEVRSTIFGGSISVRLSEWNWTQIKHSTFDNQWLWFPRDLFFQNITVTNHRAWMAWNIIRWRKSSAVLNRANSHQRTRIIEHLKIPWITFHLIDDIRMANEERYGCYSEVIW